MICKVRETVKKYSMPLRGSRVIVALSGGADSMSLLNVLSELREEYGMSVEACHVNHGIRGESADRDEEFVINECKKLGVILHVHHAGVPEMAKELGIGLEECGRRVRYEFFSLFENCLIATAHTLSDRCETLLLNETRGASLRGLSSIPPVRGNIIRPLIECTREDIEKYCAEKGIAYVTDETNADDTYSRNRIRLNVITELKKINPSFEKAVARLTESVSEDEDYFTGVADGVIKSAETDGGYSAEVIASQHGAVKRRVISEILRREADITPELIHIKMIEDILHGGRTQILGDTVVEVRNGVLKINPEAEVFSEWEYDFSSFSARTPAGKIFAEVFNRNDLPPQQNVHNMVLDFDDIRGSLVLRNRRAGDRMKCAGSSCTKTLKKIFSEKHLENRGNLPVLADDEGILWVKNVGCADRCKIKKETEKIFLIGEEL